MSSFIYKEDTFINSYVLLRDDCIKKYCESHIFKLNENFDEENINAFIHEILSLVISGEINIELAVITFYEFGLFYCLKYSINEIINSSITYYAKFFRFFTYFTICTISGCKLNNSHNTVNGY